MIELRGVSKTVESGGRPLTILHPLDLAIPSGRFLAVVGPSGSGKSTLLGLLDRPQEGEVIINGEKLAHASDEARTSARNRLLGFVFQFHFLLPEFTALENVMLPMRKLGRLDEPAMLARAMELLRSVGLDAKAHRPATKLSGGEQQRVAIARALANEPPVLLADEPTGNLDAKNSEIVFDLLRKLAHERGLAVVMVTHNMELAARCDRVLRMRDGLFLDAAHHDESERKAEDEIQD